MKNNFTLLVLILLILPSVIFAEGVNLKNVLNLTLQNNPDIVIMKKNIKNQKQRLILPKFSNNPELSFTINNNLNPQDTFYKGSDISVSMPIEIMGQNSLRKRIVSGEIEILKAKLKKFEDELSYKVANKFVKIYFLQKKIKETENLLKMSNKLLNQTKLKSEAGQVSVLNLNTAMMQSSLLSDNILSMKNQLDVQKIELESLINSKIPENSEFILKNVENLPDEKILMKSSIKSNADILILQKEIEVDSVKIQLIKLQNKISTISPSLGLSQEGKNLSTSIGVSIPIPIFNKKLTEIQTLYNDISINRLKIAKIKKEIKNKIEIYYHKLKANKKRIKNYEINIIPLIKKNLNLSESLYLSGEIDFDNFERYYQSLYDAQMQYFNLLNDYYQNIYQIKKLSGTINR